MSLFIAFVKCESMTFLAIFKIFTGIPSGAVTFLGFKDLGADYMEDFIPG